MIAVTEKNIQPEISGEITVVGEDRRLVRDLQHRAGYSSLRFQTARWNPQGHGEDLICHWHEIARWSGRPDSRNILLLNLTAPDAPPANAILEITKRYPQLRILLVMDIRRADSAPVLESLLGNPGVDFVRSPANVDELWQRLLRLLRDDKSVADTSSRHLDNPLTSPAPVLRHIVPALHNQRSGRLDARRVAELYGVPVAELARLLSRLPATVHKTPDAETLQPNLTLFERIAAPLLYLTGDSPQNLRVWMNAANQALGGSTPMELLREGKGALVAEMLEDLITGQMS